MLDAGWGRVANISSISAAGHPERIGYASAKAGLIGFAKTLALEFGRHDVTANAIAPALIVTDMTRRSAARHSPDLDDYVREAVTAIPVRRWAAWRTSPTLHRCSSAARPASSPVRCSTSLAAPSADGRVSATETSQPAPTPALAVRDRGGLRARPGTEPGENPRDMGAGRLLRHEQGGADLAVRDAFGQQGEHLALTRREPERVVGGRRRRLVRRRQLQSCARGAPLDLAAQPAGAEAARGGVRVPGR